MRSLSALQIERLYQFTRQHYVEYYDVQTELVDHLASAIEAQWLKNPEKDFESLLQQEFKKFGVFGFMEVVEKRQKIMHWHYLKLLWKETKDYLKLPKVLIVVFMIWIISFIFIRIENGILMIASISLICIFALFILAWRKLHKLRKQVKEKKKKLYLLEETILNLGGSFLLIYFPINTALSSGFVSHPEKFSIYLHIFAAFLFTLSYLLIYITFYVLPSKKERLLKKAYPEMNLENV